MYVIPLALGVLMGCSQIEKKDNEPLLAKIDSLELALEANSYSITLLDQIGKYLDSIDVQRKNIRINLETGLTEAEYLERMRDLNDYVQKAEWTINELEKTRSAYASQVKRLKTELKNKDLEISNLHLKVSEIQEVNAGLTAQLKLSAEDLLATQLDLTMVQEELGETESEVEELMSKVKLTEAEVYFSRGQGMEEVAQHIQLAPKRKKETLQQAIVLYAKARDLGHKQANERVNALQKRVK